MTFPRISSLVLAIGGCVWAFLLLGATLQALRYSAGGLVFFLMWLPGFIAWYGYIRHALGHYLFRQARITWLVSLAANTWSLFLLHGRISIGLAWTIMALILSLACAVKEWQLREPEHQVSPQVAADEFARLLNEHRRKER